MEGPSYEAATTMMMVVMTMMIMMSWARKWALGQVGQWERFPSYPGGTCDMYLPELNTWH